MIATVAAATRPETWLRAPMLSLTVVREPLAPIGKPWLSPATRFPAPIASSSCEPRTLWWCLPANDRAVRISSANETTKIPAAAGMRWTICVSGGDGNERCGSPDGIAPTIAMPCDAKSNPHERAIATTTTRSAAGSFGRKRFSTNSDDERARGEGGRRAADAAELADHLPQLPERVIRALIDRPRSLGELADDEDDRDAVARRGTAVADRGSEHGSGAARHAASLAVSRPYRILPPG